MGMEVDFDLDTDVTLSQIEYDVEAEDMDSSYKLSQSLNSTVEVS